MQAIRMGLGMVSDLRLPLWRALAPWYEIESELKIKMGIGSVFDDVYEKIFEQAESKVEPSIKRQIQLDIRRTKSPLTGDELSGEDKK